MRFPAIACARPQRPRRHGIDARAVVLTLCLCCGSTSQAGEFAATYKADLLSNRSGGLATGTRFIDNLQLEWAVDLEDSFGTGAGQLFFHGLYNNSTRFTDELVGDLQVVSNIDAAEAWRVFEAWYETGGERWSVRAGLYDLNSEFDAHETGGLFLNSSHGIGAEFGQTGRNGPSIFPVSSLGLRGAFSAGPGTVRVAVLDGVPGDANNASSNRVSLESDEGYLGIAEYDVPLGEAGRLWAGYWSYSAEFERPFGAGRSDGNDGWYIGTERSFAAGSRQIAWFVRYGQANPQLNPIEAYLGAGVVIKAPFTGRVDDQAGIAVASAGLGTPYRDWLAADGYATRARETVVELTYRASVGEHVFLQPDVQFITNPSGLVTVADSLVIGIRLEVAY